MIKRAMRMLGMVAAVLGALLACSCIDGREEYWLAADGSGRAEIHYQVPIAAAVLQGGQDGIREILGHLLEANEAIFSDATHEVHTEDGVLHIRMKVAFASAIDLADLKLPEGKVPLPVRHFAGVFEFSQDGRLIGLRRTLEPGKGLPGHAFMPASQFKGKRLVYLIHLPAPALEHNATRAEDDGRTLVWDRALATQLRRPMVLELKMLAPLPRWVVPAAAGGAVLLGLLVLVVVRRGCCQPALGLRAD